MPTGRKKNGVYKLKKKTDAESALLQRIKNEVKMREIQKDLKNTSIAYARLESEQKELDARKKELDSSNEEKDEIRKEIIKLTGLTKFAVPKNETQIIATMGNLRFTCFTLHRLNSKIKEREVKSKKRLNCSYDAFCSLNLRNNVIKEILKVLQPLAPMCMHNKNTDKPRGQLERRRERLIQDISSLTENFYIKRSLNNQRRLSANKNGKTLEEYLDTNTNNAETEIRNYSKRIKVINEEVRDIGKLINDEKEEIARIKKVLRQVPKTDIKSTSHYQKVLTRNNKIQEELDAQLSKGDELHKETMFLLAKLEENLKNDTEDSETANDIRNLLNELNKREKYIEEKEVEESSKRYDDMAKEIAEGEHSLKEMISETKKLENECESKLNMLNVLKCNASAVDKENEACLQLISRMAQDTLEKLWYT